MELNAYVIIIASSLLIICSYLFNIIAKRTNVPSVLMLIVFGILINQGMGLLGIGNINWYPILEVLGIVGLIMIVLEAALDLKIEKGKGKLIRNSFLLAFFSLAASSMIIAFGFSYIFQMDLFNSLLYAIPISIMSSAIVIPGVENLSPEKKEFMIYESTFSDILGIMFFYFLIGSLEADGATEVGLNIGANVIITVVLSAVLSYVIIFVFQKLQSQIKLFLLVSILVLLYAVGKSLHLSSLLMILVFGLILNNRKLFFFGKLKKYADEESLKPIYSNFHLITMESAFVVRTFFFVIFGITVSLGALFDIKVILISFGILIVLYGIRFLIIRFFMKEFIKPVLFIAPRGLITILLFFAIPKEFQIKEFNSGILLFVILVSAFIMAWALIKDKKAGSIKTTKEDDSE